MRVAVWTITQLVSPDRMFALLPERSAFAGGHRTYAAGGAQGSHRRGAAAGPGARPDGEDDDRDRRRRAAVGRPGRESDTSIGSTENRQPAAETAPRPGGAHAQIYTSPDGAEPYVELELLGPLVDLAPGQSAALDVRYRLLRREEADPLAEARRVCGDALGRRP